MDGSAGFGANGMGHMSVMDEQVAAARAAGVLMQGAFAGTGQRAGTGLGTGHKADGKATDWIDQFLQPGAQAGVFEDGKPALFSRVTPGTAAE